MQEKPLYDSRLLKLKAQVRRQAPLYRANTTVVDLIQISIFVAKVEAPEVYWHLAAFWNGEQKCVTLRDLRIFMGLGAMFLGVYFGNQDKFLQYAY